MYKKLRNAFGKIYEKDLLSEKEIKERFESFDFQEIVKKAYDGWVESYNDGVCELDCSTGKLVSASYSQGSGDIEGAHYIELYRIGRNWEFETDDHEEEIYNWVIYDGADAQIEENFETGLRDLMTMIKEEN